MSGRESGRRSVLAQQEAPRPSVLLSSSGAFSDASRRDSTQAPHSSHGRASIRKSALHPQAGNRYSRASLARGSVRGPRGADAAGLPFERIVCIDEEGRDRTPKPLVAARPHGAPSAEHLGNGWGSESPGGNDPPRTGSDRTSIMSFGLPFTASSIPSARSFMVSETGEPSQEPSEPSQLPAGRSAGGQPEAPPGTAAAPAAMSAPTFTGLDSSGKATPPGATLLENGRPGLVAQQAATQGRQPEACQKRHAQQLSSKASQCTAPVALANRGTQVLPWELRSSACDGTAADTEPEGSFVSQRGAAAAAAAAALLDDETGALDDMEDAMLAMQQQQQMGAAADSRRASPTLSSRGMHSQSTSRRGSVTGIGRKSTMHSEDSRPPTGMDSRRSSMQASEWSARDSMVSNRASFAAYMADGGSSVMSTAGGFGGRASVLSVNGGQHTQQQQQQQRRGSAAHVQPPVPQLSPAELAAQAARRQKAEQERALSRLPGLLHKLQVAEKAVLLNVQHSKLAAYHNVLLCHAVRAGGYSQAGSSPGQEVEAVQELQVAAGQQDDEQHEVATGSDTSAPVMDAPAALSGSRKASIVSASGDSSAAGTARVQQSELQLLWAWHSELTAELPVSCLAWNKAAPGLLAVGYGRLEYEVAGAGLVAVWSLANPSHPLWHAATPCGVSCLDWSGKAASSLAVGFFDGAVAVYDVRSQGSKPQARAAPAGANCSGGHSEPVWRLRHVPKAADPGEEMLVSISSDGRLLEWKVAQGMEQLELLRLKRQQGTARRLHSTKDSSTQAGSEAEGYLGRAAGGTCFDFNPADPRSYLVGTEEGAVHKCSTAFSEQYIQSYSGHLAPVYQVCWSPFSPTHFLTASADWTVRLWSEALPRSLWTFQLLTAKAEVADVAFCPAAATLFAAAAGNTLQLWDVERSVLVPCAMATRFGVRLTALAFSLAAPVVVTGGDDGVVSVYSIAGMYDAESSEQEQQQRLEAALRHHTAQHVSD